MKKFLKILLITVLALGVLAGVGMAGFRVGYAKGLAATTNGDATALFPFHGRNPGAWNHPGGNDEFGKQTRGDDQRFVAKFHGRGQGHRGGILHLIFLALVAWVVYQIFSGNGWHLSLVRHQPQATPEPNASPEPNPEPADEAETPKKTRAKKTGN